MNDKGFTLIELICILLIVGILGTVISVKYSKFSDNVDKGAAKYEQKAVDRYNVIKSTGMETGVEDETLD